MLKFSLNHGGGFSKSSVETSRTMWSMTQSEVGEIVPIAIKPFRVYTRDEVVSDFLGLCISYLAEAVSNLKWT